MGPTRMSSILRICMAFQSSSRVCGRVGNTTWAENMESVPRRSIQRSPISHILLTVYSLPPHYESCYAKEKEDGAEHSFPLVGRLIHLCIRVVELDVVNCGKQSESKGLRHTQIKHGPHTKVSCTIESLGHLKGLYFISSFSNIDFCL